MTTLPAESAVPQSLSADEFVSVALANLERGYAPIPIGRRDKRGRFKSPWIAGYHGCRAKTVPADAISRWPAEVADRIACGEGILSLGLVLPGDVVGLDVDAYDGKNGLATIETWAQRWGPLPPTFTVTARRDGSGIRLYRKPVEWEPLETPGSGVEFIDHNHRYIAAPPSWHHIGQPYRLLTPERKRRRNGVLPPRDELPALPDNYLDGLKRSARAGGCRSASSAEVESFAAQHTAGKASGLLEPVLRDYSTALANSPDSTHRPTFSTLCRIARESRVGAYAWSSALVRVRDLAAEHYEQRDRAFDAADFDRMIADAIGSANAENLTELEARTYRAFGTDSRTTPNDFVGSVFDRPASEGTDTSATTAFSSIKPTRVEWLWYGWLPLGKVSILEGDSDVGKSTITLAMASIVSQGKPWPTTRIGAKSVESMRDPANVVLVGIEDDDSDTVVPRLIAAGADRSRVHKLNRPVDSNGDAKPFTIPDDIDWLRRAITEVKAELVVIDPIAACLPENVKHGVDASIRRVLMYIVDLAAETGCAILLVRHFNKAQGMSAKHRGGGSVAYSALVRSVIQAGPLTKKTEDGATYALARAIGNLSKQPESIGYALESAPDNPEVPLVTWRGPVDLTADQLVGADNAKIGDARKNAPIRDMAVQSLREVLKAGPMRMKHALDTVMRETACGKKTVASAAKQLGVIKSAHYGADSRIDYWTWGLPPDQITIKD